MTPFPCVRRLAVACLVLFVPASRADEPAAKKRAPEPELSKEVAAALEGLKSNDYKQRDAAAKELGKLKAPAPPQVLRGLCTALYDSPKNIRSAILEALVTLKPSLAKPMVDLSDARQGDWIKTSHKEAIAAIDDLTKLGPEAIPAESLIRSLLRYAREYTEPHLHQSGLGEYKTFTVTAASIRAFVAMGASEQATYETLLEMVDLAAARKYPAHTRLHVVESLQGMATDKAIDSEGKDWLVGRMPSVLRNLASGDAGVRLAAVKALPTYGAKAKSAIPVLRPFTKVTDEDLRNAAKDAIAKLSAAKD